LGGRVGGDQQRAEPPEDFLDRGVVVGVRPRASQGPVRAVDGSADLREQPLALCHDSHDAASALATHRVPLLGSERQGDAGPAPPRRRARAVRRARALRDVPRLARLGPVAQPDAPHDPLGGPHVRLAAASLILLCVGLGNPGVHGAVDTAAMTSFLVAAGLAAGLLARARPSWRAHALGLAGGVLYGAADVAIKALTGEAHAGGAAAVLTSPWLPAAAIATMGAFFAFQRGLQSGRAVPVISLMTAATTAV